MDWYASINSENDITTTGGDSENNVIEIYYGSNNEEDQLSIANPSLENVAGFQFDISGITITGASGGSAEAAEFSVSTSASGVVLGFSFEGETIPAGSNGTLVVINFDVDRLIYIKIDMWLNTK